MENKLHEYRHFILYAKRWYTRNDVIEDLKTILENYCEVDRIQFNKEDLIMIFVSIVKNTFNHPNQNNE